VTTAIDLDGSPAHCRRHGGHGSLRVPRCVGGCHALRLTGKQEPDAALLQLGDGSH
jgi:hypothetical protein